MQRAHRVSYELSFGPIPDGLHILHSCDNPPCVNVDHLFLGTHADNTADKVAKMRHARKLTVAQVEMIRCSDDTDASLGRQLGVARSTISLIREGKHWGWL